MLSKLKRPVLFLITAIISVQVFQILYREYVFEVSQSKTKVQDDISKDAEKDTFKNAVTNFLEIDGKRTNKNKHKNIETSSTSETSTISETTTETTTTTKESALREKVVTSEAEAKIAQRIRDWRFVPERERTDNTTLYHGRDLLKDVSCNTLYFYLRKLNEITCLLVCLIKTSTMIN